MSQPFKLAKKILTFVGHVPVPVDLVCRDLGITRLDFEEAMKSLRDHKFNPNITDNLLTLPHDELHRAQTMARKFWEAMEVNDPDVLFCAG